jgi:hypothetical protein
MNPRLIMLGLGLAVGYVLGTRDGRERYDWMKAKVTGAWEDPRVAKARHDLDAYVREQAPIIRERAEAAAKAAPGVIADAARDVADTAKEVAARTAETAKDVAARTAETAKEVAGKVSATAKDVADKAVSTASDVRAQAGKVAGDLRNRGEAVVESAVTSVGQARDAALETVDDEDDPTPSKS